MRNPYEKAIAIQHNAQRHGDCAGWVSLSRRDGGTELGVSATTLAGVWNEIIWHKRREGVENIWAGCQDMR
jgi:hypothetical protein